MQAPPTRPPAGPPWQPPYRSWLERLCGGRVRSTEPVQSLWSGYGQLVRVELDSAERPSVVVKWIDPPSTASHPRGFHGDASHRRKLASYENERRLYRLAPAGDARLARCYAAVADDDGHRAVLVLEDLRAKGFPRTTSAANPTELRACLAWLASWHAKWLHRPPPELFEVGTYWHLATRQDELRVMRDERLRAAAAPLDAMLRGARHQTLVHGDAKVANFCFREDGTRAAAVDFQYAGGGPGIVDVAYLLSSCLDDDGCAREADAHLDTYFTMLRQRLADAELGEQVAAEWRALYPAAWADFHRFLDGWAPDHWKIHAYTRRMTSRALAQL